MQWSDSIPDHVSMEIGEAVRRQMFELPANLIVEWGKPGEFLRQGWFTEACKHIDIPYPEYWAEAERLTVRTVQYALSVDARLAAIYTWNGDAWEFLRTCKMQEAKTVCFLERCAGQESYAFPMGMIPEQVWSLICKLEKEERIKKC